MFKKQSTKAIPPGTPSRVVKGKREVQFFHLGKIRWVPVNANGKAVLESGYWYAKIGGLPVRLARDKTAAEQVLAAKRRQREREEVGLALPELKPSEETVAKALENWNREMEEKDLAAGYRTRQVKRVGELLTELGVTMVHQVPRLTTDQIEKVASRTKVGILGSKGKRGEVQVVPASPAVQSHNITGLAIFFSWLKRRKYLGVTPELPQRSKLKGVRAAISIDQLRRLTQFCDEQYRVFYLLAFSTLARVGSLTTLRIRDCHFEFRKGSRMPVSGSISLLAKHTKTRQANRITVAKDLSLVPLYGWILQRRGEGAGDDDLAFTLNLKKISRRFKTQMGLAGLPTKTPDGNVTPHSLRHGGATHLLLCGVSPFKVMKVGGWKNMDVLVKHYGHVISSDASEEVDRYMKWPGNRPE
jgi:integrase